MRAASLPIGDLLERDLERQTVGTKTSPGVARLLGWRCYHTLRSKGSEAGYPDWTLVRDRVVFLELKRASGTCSPAQKTWIAALLDAGAEAYVVRPADLDMLAVVLGHHGDPWLTGRTRVVDAASTLRVQTRNETT